jgi:hypothetical protein
MAYTPKGVAQPLELIKVLNRLAASWPPEVVREDHWIGEDWNGDPAINFTIVLRDHAAARERLLEVASRIQKFVDDEVDPQGQWDLIPYFRFISESENEQLKRGAIQ